MAGLTNKNYSYNNVSRSEDGTRVRSTGRSVVNTGGRVVVGNPGTGLGALQPDQIRKMVEEAKSRAGLGAQQIRTAATQGAQQARLAAGATADQVRALVQQMAAERGWTGPQWNALNQLIMKESGYRPTIKNPTSTAYGIFQFLDSTWKNYGFQKTADPAEQTRAGLHYIAQRYKDPVAALNFHLRNNWY